MAFVLVTVAALPDPAAATHVDEGVHAPAAASGQPSQEATVSTDGTCLTLRAQPDAEATALACLPDGSVVTLTDAGDENAGGITWQQVRAGERIGWVAASQLSTASPLPLAVADGPAEALLTPYAFTMPPPGGLTFGFAGTSSVAEVIAAQPFQVQSLTVIDRETQQYLTYIPGAPAYANTLQADALDRDMVVLARRADGDAPAPVAEIAGSTLPEGLLAMPDEPEVLDAPPPGGFAVGIARTSDLDAFIGWQQFVVQSVITLDVPSQQWLVHISGAPAAVNTLDSTNLQPGAFVLVRRAGGEQLVEEPAEPEPKLVSGGVARITYYFCERGKNPGAWGDGGGFCGYMASGQRVYEGAAACARHLMGQRFTIAGDPYGRVYTCADTGGGVRGNHRDIFFWNSDVASAWYRTVGYHAEIFILE